jgi:hypothetical protein
MHKLDYRTPDKGATEDDNRKTLVGFLKAIAVEAVLCVVAVPVIWLLVMWSARGGCGG